MIMKIKSFTIDERTLKELDYLKNIDGFNLSALIRKAIHRAYKQEVNGYNVQYDRY